MTPLVGVLFSFFCANSALEAADSVLDFSFVRDVILSLSDRVQHIAISILVLTYALSKILEGLTLISFIVARVIYESSFFLRVQEFIG